MRIGVDLHGVIDDDVELFRLLAAAVRAYNIKLFVRKALMLSKDGTAEISF